MCGLLAGERAYPGEARAVLIQLVPRRVLLTKLRSSDSIFKVVFTGRFPEVVCCTTAFLARMGLLCAMCVREGGCGVESESS